MTADEIWIEDSHGASGDTNEGWLGALLRRKAGLPQHTLTALQIDTEHILSCVMHSLSESTDGFVSGLVVGAVQSGKTSSMLAVAAAAIDASFDIVVLVSGTRVALWQQTLTRAREDLDGWPAMTDALRDNQRFWLPSARSARDDSLSPRQLYERRKPEGQRHLAKGRPVVIITMKQGDHLSAVARAVRGLLSEVERPARMLVIDDEADDGSILNADKIGTDEAKLIPRQLTAIWSKSGGDVSPFIPKLQVAYLAYTATPQANLLQHDHNPLSPRDFVTAIRTPGASGASASRDTPTYKASNSLSDWYTGGAEFYPKTTAEFQPCIPLRLPDPWTEDAWNQFRTDSIGNALRAFIVGAACRLVASGEPQVTANDASFPTRAEAASATPPVCSMLFNPGSNIDSHFEGERLIRDWIESASPKTLDQSSLPARDRPQLNWLALEDHLSLHETLWRDWHEDYLRAAEQLHSRAEGRLISTPADWPTVRNAIVSAVIPRLRLQVVNSADAADQAPDFSPQENQDGTWRPTDLAYSVFVAGNVMSRGLTLEGLHTTLFLRNPTEPTADTQMQMQRWFGYRGKYLQYCRVFVLATQLAKLREYQDDDEALRAEIFEQLRRSKPRGIRPQVLSGAGYRATGKVQCTATLPLCPGAAPFIQILWDQLGPDPNVDSLRQLAEKLHWDPVQTTGSVRGLIARQTLSPLEVADFLDSLCYFQHDPSPMAETHARWDSLHATMGLKGDYPRFFRPNKASARGTERAPPTQCPYSIAAYLRFWEACRTRAVPGVSPTDLPQRIWAHLSTAERERRIPKFRIGIKFGSIPLDSNHPLAAIGTPLEADARIRLLSRKIDHENAALDATWGSRNASENYGTYLGDQYFDYHRPDCERRPDLAHVGDTCWRVVGEDGLVLIHIIASPDGPRLATGLCIPAGGPDQLRVLRPVGSAGRA